MDQVADQVAEIRELELSLHRADVRASRPQLAELLADDFVEFGSSGRIYDKTAIVDVLTQERGRAQPPAVHDFAVRFLAPSVALATYRAIERTRETLRCSIWHLESGKWRMAFHQGTPRAQ